MTLPKGHLTSLLACMPEGIGDLTFGTDSFLEVAQSVLSNTVSRRGSQLPELPAFTMCFVGHNPPAYLHLGGSIAWNFTINGAEGRVAAGELPESECDYRIEGDHSLMSNYARVLHQGVNPAIRQHATNRLERIGRWEIGGKLPDSSILISLLHEFHDQLASRVMPRFTFMTPEWVSSARHVLTSRANSEKYRDLLTSVSFTFSEEFTNTPRYAFPDGSHGGFWVNVVNGAVTVGAGPLPEELGPADMLTKGNYIPVVPVGRTVNVALTDQDKSAQRDYSRAAFAARADGVLPVNQSSPSGGSPMSPELGKIFVPLHDELSKRTSSELPSDFDDGIEERWRTPQSFDRDPSFDKTWLRYEQYDIYGDEL
ncbi:MAG: hypothetical protein OXC80_03465 [Gammaproteobacteria bacterium]|nr:hypothetical protein [Gammaproteobacteria bacterium]